MHLRHVKALADLFPGRSFADLDCSELTAWLPLAEPHLPREAVAAVSTHWSAQYVTGESFENASRDSDWENLIPLHGLRPTLRAHISDCLRLTSSQLEVPRSAAPATNHRGNSRNADTAATPPPRLQLSHPAPFPVASPAATIRAHQMAPAEAKPPSLQSDVALALPRDVVKQERAPVRAPVEVIDLTGGDEQGVHSTAATADAIARAEAALRFWSSDEVLPYMERNLGWHNDDRLRSHQLEMLRLLMEGRDVFVKAPTGSGKTELLLRLTHASASVGKHILEEIPLARLVVILLLPHISTCENVLSSLGQEWRADYAGSACGETSRHGEFASMQSGSCRLFVITPESLTGQHARTIEHLIMNLKSVHHRFMLAAIDEADTLVLDEGFRSANRGAREMLEKVSDQILWMSATGSPRTLDFLVKTMKYPAQVHEIGLQGLAARPDIKILVVPFNPVENVEKTRNNLVTNLVAQNPARHSCIIFVTQMRQGPKDNRTICDDVQYLVLRLAERGITSLLLHAGLEAAEREHVLREFQAGNRTLIATEIASRVNFVDAHLIIIRVMPTSTEMLIQLIGRVHRSPSPETVAAGIHDGLAVILERPQDHAVHLDRKMRSTQNGPCKNESMKAMSILMQNTQQCLMTRIQLDVTGKLMHFVDCTCRFCCASGATFSKLPPNFRVWYTEAYEVVVYLNNHRCSAEFTAPSLVAKYIVGSKNATMSTIVARMGETDLFAVGRCHLTQKNWDSVLRAMLGVGFLRQDMRGVLFATKRGDDWFREGAPAVCLPSDEAVLRNMTQLALPAPRATQGLDATLGLDENRDISALPTLIANTLKVSRIQLVPANQYGRRLPSNAGGGMIYLLDEQILFDHPRDILEPSFKMEKRHAASVISAAFAVLRTQPEIAEFLGNADDGWALSVGYCNGAKMCPGVSADGSPCPTVDALSRKQACPRHQPVLPLTYISCSSRTLFLVHTATRRSLIATLDRHSHTDLPINKVPPAVVKKIESVLRASPHLTAATITSLQFDALNSGAPVRLLDLCEAFAVTERVEAIVRHVRSGFSSTGAEAGLAHLYQLEKEHGHTFVRSVKLDPDPSRPQLILLFSDQMIDYALNGTRQMEADGTFCTIRHTASEPKWDIYNCATFVNGATQPLCHGVMNGRTKMHYALFFTELFDAWGKARPDRPPADVLEMIVFDFERAEMAGLREACTSHWGPEKGNERFAELIRLCSVHWMRIGTKYAKALPKAQQALFRAICFRVCDAADLQQAQRCITLLGHKGKIDLRTLVDCGIPPSVAEETLRVAAGSSALVQTEVIVDWSARTRWASNLLKPKNEVILQGIFDKRPGTRSTNHVESLQDSSGLKFFKGLVSNSKAKTPLHVMESLFDASRDAVIVQSRAARGERVSQRSSSNAEERKNQKQERKDEKRHPSAELSVAADTGAPASRNAQEGKQKKQKFDGRTTCACQVGLCDNGRCTCCNKFGVGHCSEDCNCRCEKEKRRPANAALPPLLQKKKKKKAADTDVSSADVTLAEPLKSALVAATPAAEKDKAAPKPQNVTATATAPASAAAGATTAPLASAPALVPAGAERTEPKTPATTALARAAGSLKVTFPRNPQAPRKPPAMSTPVMDAAMPRVATPPPSVTQVETLKKPLSIDLTTTSDVDFLDDDWGTFGCDLESHVELRDEPTIGVGQPKKGDRCAVCAGDNFLPGGVLAAVQCTLATATKTCCLRWFHYLHAGQTLPNIVGEPWQCETCAAGGKHGKRSKKKVLSDEQGN